MIPRYKFVDIPLAKEIDAKVVDGVEAVPVAQYNGPPQLDGYAQQAHEDPYDDDDYSNGEYDDDRRRSSNVSASGGESKWISKRISERIIEKIRSPKTSFLSRHMFVF